MNESKVTQHFRAFQPLSLCPSSLVIILKCTLLEEKSSTQLCLLRVDWFVGLFYCHILKVLDEEMLVYKREKIFSKFKKNFLSLYLCGETGITEVIPYNSRESG